MPDPMPHQPQAQDIPQQGPDIQGNPSRQDIGQDIAQLKGAVCHSIGEGQQMHANVLRHILGQQAENNVFMRNALEHVRKVNVRELAQQNLEIRGQSMAYLISLGNSRQVMNNVKKYIT